jgi:hypothetical protein
MADRDTQLELDFAWAAGFLDGEGCFSLVKANTNSHPATKRPMVSASQINRAPLDKLVYLFGSIVRNNRVNSRGIQIYQWHLTKAEELKPMLECVIPFLVNKKREAEIVLEYAKWVKRRGRGADGYLVYSLEEIRARLELIEEMQGIRRAA